MSTVAKSFKNAFQVLTPTRDYGVGKRVTRGIWSNYAEPSYWEVVRIRPSPDLKHGKVFGRFTFRGKTDPKVKRINGVLKKDWSFVEARKNLQNPLGSKHARCLENNRDIYEQLILRRVRDGGHTVPAQWTFPAVRTTGECVFDPKEPGKNELFTMETNANCALFFVSCRTGNLLQCGDFNVVKCKNQNRQYYEEWRIVEPRATAVVSPLMPAQRQVMAHEERKKFVLELARCGMAAGEIESIVTRLFEMSVAIPEPNKGPVYAKRLDEKSDLA